MKKLLTLVLTIASFGFVGSWTETKAKTVTAVGKPQVRIEIGRRRRHRDRDWPRGERIGYGRTIIQTRLVQRGWRNYRETYQVTYFPNVRTETTLISRVRVY
jgi:hypothetical protein